MLIRQTLVMLGAVDRVIWFTKGKHASDRITLSTDKRLLNRMHMTRMKYFVNIGFICMSGASLALSVVGLILLFGGADFSFGFSSYSQEPRKEKGTFNTWH